MSTVLNLQNVSVTRGGRKILNDVSWTVNEGERWVVLGPNGAGKSTLLSVAAARLHPTSGEVEILDETLGAVDVFELRPRIGLSSGASATQIPATEKVSDVVVTAAYAVSGRWNEEYDVMDDERATELLAEWGVDTLALMIRDGGVVAAGPIQSTITEANLAATYDMELALTVTPSGRFSAFKRA